MAPIRILFSAETSTNEWPTRPAERYPTSPCTVPSTTSVPNGTYEKAFLHVTNASGTLTNGTQVNVSVRRGQLKVKREFIASGNASLQFTVQPTVVQRDGNYVVEPLVSESGCGCC